MPSITKTCSSINDDHSYGNTSTNYPFSNFYGVTASDGNSYGGFDAISTNNSVNYIYLQFDFSEIPSNAVVTSITGNIAIYGSTSANRRLSTKELQFFSGSTAKGDPVSYKLSQRKVIYTLNGGDGWTRDELKDTRIRVYAVRGNNTNTAYTYIMGADVTVTYELSADPIDDGDKDEEQWIEQEPQQYQYTGASQTVVLEPGRYKLQCWGAQGGTYENFQGGLGGYSEGILTLTETTTLYLYIGGQPAANSTARSVTQGGFNGGGNGQNRYYSNTYTYGQGGGGGTDIRIGSESLYARVIVAGGGGGSASQTDTSKYGGGTLGGPGGAATNSQYIAGQTPPTTSNYYVAGTFGQGAAAHTNRTDYQHGSGGGGGGWYGGYAYNYAQDNQPTLRTYNGGGSGYVYTSATATNYPSGCLLNETYYLENAQTIGGNTSFVSTSGDSETGHSGNGYIKITKIVENAAAYIKRNGQWKRVVKMFLKKDGKWVRMRTANVLGKYPNNSLLPYNKS